MDYALHPATRLRPLLRLAKHPGREVCFAVALFPPQRTTTLGHVRYYNPQLRIRLQYKSN